MSRILITGMSGTGKSTVLAELGARGVPVLDMDDPGWSIEVPIGDGPELEQLWNEEPLDALLARTDFPVLVIGGGASNQVRFYDRLDDVVLLTAPVDVLLERITTRTTNDFGKHPGELQRILRDLEVVQPLLVRSSSVELDATLSVSELADAIEALARRT